MAINIPKKKYKRAVIYANGDTVVLEGEIDQSNPETFLEPFFKKASSLMTTFVYIDITGLEFLNSAGIKCILDFLMKRKSNSRVIIRTDRKKTWQRTAIDVIQSLDKENILLEE
ncbi:MAG: anti-sigma factor antagonist [Spirochaetales bacterium]|nr:anti-sigma factor antagonist [Spirochaetales bacterium]